MLYKVNLQALKNKDYENAFTVVAPLHQPEISDDRDVMLFPRRLKINGQEKIICIHRPKTPWNYGIGKDLTAPSIFFALGDELTDFYEGKAESFVFAVPEYPWEANRIGCSWADRTESGGFYRDADYRGAGKLPGMDGIPERTSH